jgi:hypothetical protein
MPRIFEKDSQDPQVYFPKIPELPPMKPLSSKHIFLL